MKNLIVGLMAVVVALVFSSCTDKESDLQKPMGVELSGTLQKIDAITTYQYGTYFIDTTALRSETIDLELYVDELVTVKGTRIDGYPLSGGPVFVEVEHIAPFVLSPGDE